MTKERKSKTNTRFFYDITPIKSNKPNKTFTKKIEDGKKS